MMKRYWSTNFTWAGTDSNRRRRKPPDLQSGAIDRSATDPLFKFHYFFYFLSRRPDLLSVCQNFRRKFWYKPESASGGNWQSTVYPPDTFEPPIRFELITYCLQNSCSTMELGWRVKRAGKTIAPLRLNETFRRIEASLPLSYFGENNSPSRKQPFQPLHFVFHVNIHRIQLDYLLKALF